MGILNIIEAFPDTLSDSGISSSVGKRCPHLREKSMETRQLTRQSGQSGTGLACSLHILEWGWRVGSTVLMVYFT